LIFNPQLLLISACRRYLNSTASRPASSSLQPTFEQPFDVDEFLSDVLDPSQATKILQQQFHLICVRDHRPLWLLRCLTIFASPNPFVLFLRCLHHAIHNRFNEAVSACVGFVRAVDKLRSDSRAHVTGEPVICVRGLLVLSVDAMVALARGMADDLLATGVSAWWRDRWCQTCASAGLPCKAAASAPILRALHEHGLNLRIFADSCNAYTADGSSLPQQQQKMYETWLEALRAPIACDESSVQEMICRLVETSNGHATAKIVLALIHSGAMSSPEATLRHAEISDQQHHVYHHHQHRVLESEINANWQEKVRSPSWGCSPDYRTACVESCKHLLLEAKKLAADELSQSAAADNMKAIADIASRFFFSVLRQLVCSPPAGKRCTRTEERVRYRAIALQ
jgi:hypothetical protein